MSLPPIEFVRHSMRYKIGKDIIVKSENAAKPRAQRSRHLLSILSTLPNVTTSLDYGCGKLRYADEILKTTDRLVVCDSEIQLTRVQKLDSKYTSIHNYYLNSNSVTPLTCLELAKSNHRFERAFCINVLSVIPIYSRREDAIDLIRSKLVNKASCLFVVQYRNSDFSRMCQMPNARPWRDGFIIDSLRGYSFYGLISPDKLTQMLKRVGYKILDLKLNDGSAFVWASR